MLFCDPLYFTILLPITAVIYWLAISKKHFAWAIPILLFASTIFYITWSWQFFLLLLASASINYFIWQRLLSEKSCKKLAFYTGISFNLILLSYFKYFNFFVDNINCIFATHLKIAQIVLPLGISFYTFQQIAYLVDAYKRLITPCHFQHYLLFVIYFPQLVAGPIVHYQEMMPQFGTQRQINWDNIYKGILLFLMGLSKKILIADWLAKFVEVGYNSVDQLSLVSAWLTSFAYTFQLYFDFSGYANMAIGSGLLFGIKLPDNFNSPYQALNIQDFWRRWHMTLSTWLKNYLYIPLGGNHCSLQRTCFNLFMTFFLGGIWHGAGWGFVIWGALHGLASVIHRLWVKTGLHINKFLAWFMTFNFINIAWIFFRAKTAHNALALLKTMFDFRILKDIHTQTTIGELKHILNGTLFSGSQWLKLAIAIAACLTICLLIKNTKQLCERYWKPFGIKTFMLCISFWILLFVISSRGNKIDFLYWQF